MRFLVEYIVMEIPGIARRIFSLNHVGFRYSRQI